MWCMLHAPHILFFVRIWLWILLTVLIIVFGTWTEGITCIYLSFISMVLNFVELIRRNIKLETAIGFYVLYIPAFSNSEKFQILCPVCKVIKWWFVLFPFFHLIGVRILWYCWEETRGKDWKSCCHLQEDVLHTSILPNMLKRNREFKHLLCVSGFRLLVCANWIEIKAYESINIYWYYLCTCVPEIPLYYTFVDLTDNSWCAT